MRAGKIQFVPVWIKTAWATGKWDLHADKGLSSTQSYHKVSQARKSFLWWGNQCSSGKERNTGCLYCVPLKRSNKMLGCAEGGLVRTHYQIWISDSHPPYTWRTTRNTLLRFPSLWCTGKNFGFQRLHQNLYTFLPNRSVPSHFPPCGAAFATS